MVLTPSPSAGVHMSVILPVPCVRHTWMALTHHHSIYCVLHVLLIMTLFSYTYPSFYYSLFFDIGPMLNFSAVDLWFSRPIFFLCRAYIKMNNIGQTPTPGDARLSDRSRPLCPLGLSRCFVC